MIFALIDAWQVARRRGTRRQPLLWTLAIPLLPVVGALLWLFFGRLPGRPALPRTTTIPASCAGCRSDSDAQ